MRRETEPQPDPAEIQPTDNSSGTPVDLERLEEIHEETDSGT